MKIGIEAISVFNLPPVEFVTLAAELGCAHISTGLTSYGFNPHGYDPYSLRDDAQLRREMLAAMKDTGVSISLGEGFTVREGRDVAALSGDLDLMRELGVVRINTVSMDGDLSRSFDQFAALAEMAGERDMVATVEFAPSLAVADLETALDAVRHVARENFRLLIDTMHFVRSGATAADIARLPPELIDYVQICDAPLAPRFDSYFEESMFERVIPGKGELGLAEVVSALPRERVFALEVPLRSEAEAGLGPRDRLAKAVVATRELLARA